MGNNGWLYCLKQTVQNKTKLSKTKQKLTSLFSMMADSMDDPEGHASPQIYYHSYNSLLHVITYYYLYYIIIT